MYGWWSVSRTIISFLSALEPSIESIYFCLPSLSVLRTSLEVTFLFVSVPSAAWLSVRILIRLFRCCLKFQTHYLKNLYWTIVYPRYARYLTRPCHLKYVLVMAVHHPLFTTSRYTAGSYGKWNTFFSSFIFNINIKTYFLSVLTESRKKTFKRDSGALSDEVLLASLKGKDYQKV